MSGGGGAPLYSKVTEPGSGDVYESVHHFCIADVLADSIQVSVYRPDLSVLDHFTVPIK